MTAMRIKALAPWFGSKRDAGGATKAPEVLLINGPSYGESASLFGGGAVMNHKTKTMKGGE